MKEGSNMRQKARLASLLALLLLWLGVALAADDRNLVVQPAKASGARIALVIGNGDYKDAPLRNPPNDAEDIAATLRGLGFDVILRKNANQQLTKAAIREFGQKLRGADSGLFYYAGHGLQVKGINYLVPVAVDIQSEADAEDQGVSLDYVMRTMEESGAKFNVSILDACRNNPFARSFRSVSRGLAQTQAASGMLIAYATSPGSVAADGSGRNGIYTKHLLKNLKEGDSDILKVFQRVRTGVVTETGGKQTPWETTSLIGDYYFKPGTQVATLVPTPAQPAVHVQSAEEIEQELWNNIKDSNQKSDFDDYLKQYPQGRFSPLAKQKIKSQSPQPAPVTAQPARPSSQTTSISSGVFHDCPDCPEMVPIPGKNYAMGKTHVTRGEFAAFVNATGYQTGGSCWIYDGSKWEYRSGSGWRNPGFSQDDSHPVVCVNWNDAQAYAQWLSRKTGKQYQRPSEAEWEYACRAGAQQKYCGSDNLDAVGWYDGNSGNTTHPVRQKQSNAWGLYDMSGNVWEWTQDCWEGRCGKRVVRGGSWINSGPESARAADRSGLDSAYRSSSLGFRLSRTLP